ncbi:MAG: PaaI family thioesterase [Gemmobacter sp.]
MSDTPAPRHARRPEDLASRDVLLSMSGLAFLDAILRGEIAGPPIAGLLDFRLTAAGPGTATFRGTPRFAFTNPMGGVHGGWYGAILDSALGCAAMSVVPQGHWYTTLEYKVNLARALPLDAEVEAAASVVHAGRSTVVAEARLTGVADGRLYATGSTTCLVMAG